MALERERGIPKQKNNPIISIVMGSFITLFRVIEALNSKKYVKDIVTATKDSRRNRVL